MNQKQKEQHLNNLYSECFTEDQVVDQFIYLTNKNRHGGTTTLSKLRQAHRESKLGTLLKRLDPTAFYCAD